MMRLTLIALLNYNFLFSSKLILEPFDQFLNLNPPFAHGLAIQHNDNQILIARRQAWPGRLCNPGLNALEPILQQLIGILDPVTVLKGKL